MSASRPPITIDEWKAGHDRLMESNARLRSELEELRDFKADIEETHRIVMSEPCNDEQHCTCVPVLRRELEAANKRATDAEKEAREARRWIHSLYAGLQPSHVHRMKGIAEFQFVLAIARSERENNTTTTDTTEAT